MERTKFARKMIIPAFLLLLWLVFFVNQIEEYKKYRFFHITNWANTFDYILWIIIVPLFLIVILILSAYKWKKINYVGVSVLACFILILSFFHLSFDNLYASPFYSFTDNIINLGKYDEYVETQMQVRPESGFPDQIPRSAESIRYSYWYIDAASRHYCIMVSWYLPNEKDFETETTRLRQCGYALSEDENVFVSNSELNGTNSTVLIDWEKNRLVYFFYSPIDERFVAKSWDEYDSTSYSNEWVIKDL